MRNIKYWIISIVIGALIGLIATQFQPKQREYQLEITPNYGLLYDNNRLIGKFYTGNQIDSLIINDNQ